MKKWSLLVATLMLMGATATTFTSCVDTDEPDGILEMRKAKAEYIRALAAVENAKIAHVQAQAQSEAATAELLKAQTQVALAQAEVEKAKAQAEIIKAEAEAKAEALLAEGKNEIAKAEAAKILAEAAQAEAECQQTIAQNEIALKEMQANLEVKLQMAQTELVKAQMAYQQALKDLAVLDLIASPYEAALIAQARTNYENAYYSLDYWAQQVNSKQAALIKAMYGQEDAFETLNHQLDDKKAELAAKQAAYEELKKLAENVTVTAWETRRDSLKTYVGNSTPSAIGDKGGAALEVAELQLQMKEIEQSAEWKAAKAQDEKELKAYIEAQQYYNYLTNNTDAIDCKSECAETPKQFGNYGKATTHDAAKFETSDTDYKKYTFEAIKIKVENSQLRSMLEKKGYEFEKDVITLIDKKTDQSYDKIKTAFNADPSKDKFEFSQKVTKFENDVTALKVTAEEIAADVCQEDYQTLLTAAEKEHQEKVEAWKAAHETYNTGKVATPTKTDVITAAVKQYNDSIVKLQGEVEAYNKAYDHVKDSLAAIALDLIKLQDANVQNALKTKLNEVADASLYNTIEGNIGEATDEISNVAELQQWIIDKASDSMFPFVADGETRSVVASIAAKAVNEAWDKKGTGAKQDAKEEANKTVTPLKVRAKLPANADKKMTDLATKIGTAAGSEGSVEAKNYKYTGTYATIAKALEDFADLAKTNSEKFTKDAKDANAAAKVAEATGSKAKFQSASAEVEAGDNFILKEYVKNGSTITETGHYQVSRTALNDTDLAKMIALELDKDQAEANWIAASSAAFGTNADKESARHTELTADMIQKMNEDENARVLGKFTTSSLYNVIAKQKDLAEHNALQAASADIEALKTVVTAAKEALQAAIADVQKPIDDQKKVVADAKKAHQASHNAADKLTKPVVDKINAIKATVGEMANIKGALDAIIAAYYNNQNIKYTDENGVEQKANASDFTQLNSWIKTQMKKYDTKAGVAGDDHGLIANAQAEIDKIQKQIDRYTENGIDKNDENTNLNEFLIENAKLDLEKAEAMLKLYQEKFTRAEEALAKVLEAVGNGVANGNQAIVTPEANPGETPEGNGGDYVPGQTNTDITVDLYGQANTGITIDL